MSRWADHEDRLRAMTDDQLAAECEAQIALDLRRRDSPVETPATICYHVCRERGREDIWVAARDRARAERARGAKGSGG